MNFTRTAIGSQCRLISSGVAWLSSVFSEAFVLDSEGVDGAMHYPGQVYW